MFEPILGETFRNRMEIEFAQWQDLPRRWMVSTGGTPQYADPQPLPDDPGGLPRGWAPRFVRRNHFRHIDLHLVQRLAGGVALMRHDLRQNQTSMWLTGDTLHHFHRWLHAVHPDGSPVAPGGLLVLRDWAQACLASLYDTTDPAEAAEQALLALSGTMRTPPKALF